MADARDGPVIDDRYELVRRLQHTSTVDVFRARDHLLDRIVTVVLHHDGQGTRSTRSDLAWARETGALRRLDHEHVADLADGGFAERGAFTILRVAGARLLRDECARRRPAPAQAARWCRQLADARAHMHRHGVTHGDDGPGSVLIDDDGTARWFRFSTTGRREPDRPDRGPELEGLLAVASVVINARRPLDDVCTALAVRVHRAAGTPATGPGPLDVDAASADDLADLVRRAQGRPWLRDRPPRRPRPSP